MCQDKDIRYVFWTSGWDSTYMVIQLLRDGYTVQPLYVYNPKRKSREYEMRALDKMTELIPKYIKTGKLLRYKVYSLKDTKLDPAIKRARKNILKQKQWLGAQYAYLASFAKQHHDEFPVISLGLENVLSRDSGGATNMLRIFGKLDADKRVILDESTEEIGLLFGNFDFPIIDITEEEMQKNISEWGYEEIMHEIWFCHRPLHGQPCGFCSPCFQKMASNMKNLLPEEATKRHAKICQVQQKYGKHIKKLYERCYRLFH